MHDQIVNIVQCLFSGLALGSIYAIVAIGFTIVFASTEVVNFAQGEFVMLGAMISFWLVSPAPTGMGWPLYLAVPAAVLLATVVGIMLGWVLMRPLKNASAVSLIIITVGASMFMQGVASHIWGKDPVALPPFSQQYRIIDLHLPYALTHSKDASSGLHHAATVLGDGAGRGHGHRADAVFQPDHGRQSDARGGGEPAWRAAGGDECLAHGHRRLCAVRGHRRGGRRRHRAH